jgi:hypothetical protein
MREGDFVSLPYSTRNPIGYDIPELFYRDGGLLDVPNEESTHAQQSEVLSKLMNIWSADWMHRSIYDDCNFFPCDTSMPAESRLQVHPPPSRSSASLISRPAKLITSAIPPPSVERSSRCVMRLLWLQTLLIVCTSILTALLSHTQCFTGTHTSRRPGLRTRYDLDWPITNEDLILQKTNRSFFPSQK